jgi:hypothetical protein
MITICAWCKCLIKETDEEPLNEISHGICSSCAADRRKEMVKLKNKEA